MIYPLTIAQPRDWARWAECEAATRRQVEPVCPYHSEARPESSEGKELRAAILEWIGDDYAEVPVDVLAAICRRPDITG